MGLKRNFSWMLLSRIILIAATLITAGMINRALGASARGLYAEMQTWVTFFTVLFGLSMDTAIYHFANRERYGSDDSSRFVTISLLSLSLALLAAFCLVLFVTLWPGHVSSTTAELLLLLDFLLVFTIFVTNLTVFMQATNQVVFAAFVGITQGLVNVAVITYGYFAGTLDVKYAVISLTLGQLVALVLIIGVSLKSGLISGRFSKDLATGMVSAGLKQHMATISTFIYMKINQLIVFRYCGASEAGLFAVALNLAFGFMFIPAAFQTVLYPRVIHSSDDYEVTVKSLRLVLYIWGIFDLLIIFFAKPIVLMYAGKDFLPSINTFRILMVAAWFLPVSSLLAPYYVKMGAFGMASFSAVLLGIISIGLNLFFVPRYASTGAALATSMTTLIGFCMILFFLGYLSKKSPLVIFRPDFKRELSFLKGLVGDR